MRSQCIANEVDVLQQEFGTKNRRPKINRKLIINNNQLYDCIHVIDSHAMKTHDPHDAIHDLFIMNHEKHKSPNKSIESSHEARCRAAARKVRKKTEDNIRRNQPLDIVPEVLVELRRSRVPSRAWRWRRIEELIYQ